MANDSLRNLDLNLLRTLDALLQERHVTRAADRLGLGQPAVSASLSRLRRHFNDELLQRQGNRLRLTPLAEQLKESVTTALAGVRRVFDAMPTFDPATSTREFTLVTSDYSAVVLGKRLCDAVARVAPEVRVRFQTQTVAAIDHGLETLRGVDAIVMPHGFLDDIPSVDLYADEWVCVVSQDNDQVGAAIELAQLAALPWVDVFHRPTAYTLARRHLQGMGIEPRVAVITEQFCSVPFLVAGTDRVAVLQRALARRIADAAGVRVLPCPWSPPPILEALWFHPSRWPEPAHAWLREQAQLAGQAVAGDAATGG